MRQNLTALSIDKLSHPESGDVKYWDTTVPGFGVRVTARTKSFFVVRGKQRKLTTIGRYPEISLADARKQAKVLLVQQPEKNPAASISDALAAYLEDAKSRLRPRTYLEYERHLRTDITGPLTDLKRSHAGTDPHSVAVWKAFANWCVRNELLDRNPFQYLSAKVGQRSRVLTDEELKIIWTYENPPFSDILKLCLLTGQRKGEVTRFAPEWVHSDTVTIPAAVAKNGREHTLPFNLLTAQYLSQFPRFNGFSKAKARFDKLHPLPHWTVHDLRRTFATIHAKIGTPIHVVEAMLNHKSGTVSGVAAIYIRHNFLAEARQAQLAYERHIWEIVNVR